MPGGDRRGPLGQGPMTGRGGGFCAGYAMPGYMNTCGRGFFRGGGRGRGFRRWFFATGLPGWMRFGQVFSADAPQYSTDDEVQYLKNQSEYLKKALEDVNIRLSEIGNKESR